MDSLTLFDRINLAKCAQLRAEARVCDNDGFLAEYTTARMWTKYRCYITKTHSFVESD
jgi:hypothetical protein